MRREKVPPAQAKLDEDGYIKLDRLIDPATVAQLADDLEALFAKEGDSAGQEFKQEPGSRRLANLVDKGERFRWVIAQSDVLACVQQVLGSQFKLSSLNARSANPHNRGSQPLHVDMAAIPDERGYWVCNVIWMIDDFTLTNGATRAVPGSHRWRRLPHDELADPTATHPDEIIITGEAGTVVVMNAHLWHGGLANETDHPRRALHAFYCRRDKPQQQYQKRMLSPETQDGLSAALRWLLALDDPLNDKLSAEAAVRSGFLK